MTDDRHHNDDLDSRLRSAAHAARASADASTHDADIEQALADVTAGRSVTHPDSTTGITGRRWIAWAGAAAAVVLLVAGIAIWGRDGGTVTSPTPTAPPVAATDPTTTSTSPPTAETPVPAPVDDHPNESTITSPPAEPTTEDEPGTTSPPTEPPIDDEPGIDDPPIGREPPDLELLLADVPWEHAGVGRTCPDGDRIAVTTCTHVDIDPSGVPVTFDPLSGTLTRHAREDGEYVTAKISELLLVPSAFVAGPDGVVYLAIPGDHPEAHDIIAYSLAPGDAGRPIERFDGVFPIGDSDLYRTPDGLATSGWYQPGRQPPADAEVIVDWVERDPSDGAPAPTTDPAFHDVEWVWFDDDAGEVGVGGRVWSLDERLADPVGPGFATVVGTFDGGFLASYVAGLSNEEIEIMRGYADGSVEHWILPASPSQLSSPILEPMGTFLLPHGDVFVRVAPFADRPTGWDGRLDLDFDTLAVDVTDLDEYLASLDWTTEQPPWDLGPVAFARAAVGGTGDPAELQTIRIDRVDDDGVHVVATTEGFLDDSVYGVRWDLVIAPTLDRVLSVSWSQACQPSRGHQTYVAELCT